MHDTNVWLKDGTNLCGPIWEWRQREGYFTIIGEEVRLADCKAVTTRSTADPRVRHGTSRSVRARMVEPRKTATHNGRCAAIGENEYSPETRAHRDNVDAGSGGEPGEG